MDEAYPNLRYVATLMGHCYDSFGIDDYKSTDYVWGLRLQIFIKEDNFNSIKDKLDIMFKYNLPFEYKGFLTN